MIQERPTLNEHALGRAQARAAARENEQSSALLRWLLWSPAVVVVISAVAVAGGLALFLVPLLAVGYGVFSLIAWAGAGEQNGD